MHLEELQAFVLSSSDYGESDRIVSLFTLEHGRIKGFARGARKSRKRFGPALEPFARVNIQLFLKNGLSSLRSADIIDLYSGVRNNLEAIAHAIYACELLELLTPEGVSLPRLFRLFSAYISSLDTGERGMAGRRFFEANLLNILGYRPSLYACSRCGAEFDMRGALVLYGGEVLCFSCTGSGRRISINALRKLDSCLSTGKFGAIIFQKGELGEIALLLDELLMAHSGRKIKSLDFLNQVSD
ncbi:MAG: DNA repair protein RecO [Desulfuromonadaceae bacterium]|nr:DNA repair protein RecO [Desulfuromonadaceae bacterium]MDD2855642.1 DNA repair protein RecO [Desulfuromonadaceae bacterium]